MGGGGVGDGGGAGGIGVGVGGGGYTKMLRPIPPEVLLPNQANSSGWVIIGMAFSRGFSGRGDEVGVGVLVTLDTDEVPAAGLDGTESPPVKNCK